MRSSTQLAWSSRLRYLSNHLSTSLGTSKGTPTSNPVVLARLFRVLKAVLSLYTKKDHVLLALAPNTQIS